MSKIAVLGYGVVGSGVVELFYKNKETLCVTFGYLSKHCYGSS